MKTAEESAIDLFKWIAHHLGEKELNVEQCRKAAPEQWELLIKFMAEIKLNAAKWGANRAAEQFHPSDTGYCAKHNINIFATNLTLNDLPK